jgi:hypothetical protein
LAIVATVPPSSTLYTRATGVNPSSSTKRWALPYRSSSAEAASTSSSSVSGERAMACSAVRMRL